MTEQKINKSDFVDSNGKVWGSVGENIRNGSKSFESLENSLNSLDEDLKMKLPVIPIKGHWERITDTVNSDFIHSFSNYSITGSINMALLNCKIYLIVLVNSDNTEPTQSICLPFVNGDETTVIFFSNATVSCTNEYLIYIGDE